MKEFIKLNEKDNVCVALADLKKDSIVCGVSLIEDIAIGHKFALGFISMGAEVIKYGYSIGKATADINAGAHVHIHNLKTNLNEKLKYTYSKVPVTINEQLPMRKVEVYERQNGEIGIRNELWVIPTVGCVNAQAKAIADKFLRKVKKLKVDGVYAYSHPYGCSQMGEDNDRTIKILQKITKHSNAGGVLVLGLGCEVNQIDKFEAALGEYNKSRIMFLNSQDINDEITEGVKILEKLHGIASRDKRVQKDISCLKIGLKCGGSDGLSGITANPLFGMFSDYLVSCGGTAIFTEVPEMFGAETLLMQRAKDKSVFDKIVKLINNFKDYFSNNGAVIYENPSPGNKAGGISTLEEKSLGCTQKGGSSDVSDVIFDDEVVSKTGLNLLNGPGNDMIAVTNLGAAGCHLVLFSTGRGTPFGGFVPTVKVSTNTNLYKQKNNWIDFNAGDMLEIDKKAVLNKFIDYIVEVANGKSTKNELTNSREITIFKSGVTL